MQTTNNEKNNGLVIQEIRDSLTKLKDEQNRIADAFKYLDRLFNTTEDSCVKCDYTKQSHPIYDCKEFVRPIDVSILQRTHPIYKLPDSKILKLNWTGLSHLDGFSYEEKINIIENLDEIFLNCLKAIKEEIVENQKDTTSKIDEYIELLTERKEAEQ